MNPYSHIVVASRLESLVQPEDPPEYYWGAVVPDMRYLAAMRRTQTHISIPRITAFRYQYPHLESFVQGYLVHCLTDQIRLGRYLGVLLELYYLEHQPVRPDLAGTHNEVLSELGLSASVSARFAEAMRQYVAPASQSDPLALARLLGMEGDSRLEVYTEAVRWFQRRQGLKEGLFLGIRAGRIEEQIVARVAALYRRHSAAIQEMV